MNNLSFRLRISYGKTGRLRYLSHLELTRAIERLIRRAQLPYALTEGFNAHMKCAFGPALPVGTAGLCELLDVWLTVYLPARDVLERLRKTTIPGFPINSVVYCAYKAPSLQVSHTLSTYKAVIAISDIRVIPLLEQAFADIGSADSLTIMKKGVPKKINLTNQIHITPTIVSIDENSLTVTVELTLRASEQASIRPEALLNVAFNNVKDVRLIEITRILLNEE